MMDQTSTTLTTGQSSVDDDDTSQENFKPIVEGWIQEIHEMYNLGTDIANPFVIQSNFGERYGMQSQMSLDELKWWVSTTDMGQVSFHRTRPFRFLHPGQAGNLIVKKKVHKKVGPSKGGIIHTGRNYRTTSGNFANETMSVNSFLVQEIGCKRSGRH